MPKQRSTCTRCSQRRQKCDRKTPCSRCIQNKEPNLCTTQWTEGYNPSVHRKYPRRPPSNTQSHPSSSDTSSTLNESPATQQDGSSSTDPTIDPVFAIGQSKFLDITISSLLQEKDVRGPGFFGQCPRAGKHLEEPNRVLSFCSPVAKEAEMQYLQTMVPAKELVFKVVDYYHECMLYWFGGVWHWPSFRARLVEAYESTGGEVLELKELDWKWNALLFAILSSGIIGCPETLSEQWGVSIDDKVKLARTWGACSVSCLNLGNYTSQYHINSIHAIYTLHAYEHLAGSTTQWIAMKSVALVIAKGLGLHRLAPHPDDTTIPTHSPTQTSALIDRETARRTWSMLVTQDWLCCTSSPFTSVPSIQKRQFTTARPMNLDDETILPIDDNNHPSRAMVGRYFWDYASVMLEFGNEMAALGEVGDEVRYAVVLRFDGEMRRVCAEQAPKFLDAKTPLKAEWPVWVKWARTLHLSSPAHKLLTLHQSFLSKSFKDARYTYTRWTCVSSARTIITLYTDTSVAPSSTSSSAVFPNPTSTTTITRDPLAPQWWVEQAFLITASLVLILDLIHDPDATPHADLVHNAMRYLSLFPTSSVAIHGVRLLRGLMVQVTGQCNDIDAVVEPNVPVVNEDATLNFNFDIDNLDFEGLMEWLPVEGGIDGCMFLDAVYGGVGNGGGNFT